MTPQEAVTWMHAHGVKRFKTPDMEIELGATLPADSSPLVPKNFGEPQGCKCGHLDEEHHVGGLCLRGCESKLCNDEQADHAGKGV